MNIKLDSFSSSLASLLDDFNEGFLVLDHHWRILLVNRAAQDQGIADAETWIGQTLWEAVPELVGTPAESLLHKAMAERASLEFDLRWPPKPAAAFSTRLFPVSAGLGLSFKDVTALNAVRAREQELAGRLDLVLAASDLGITYLDLETQEVRLSSRAATILGVNSCHATLQEIEQGQTPQGVARGRALAQKAIETGEIVENSFPRLLPSGDRSWIMVRMRAQYDPEGRPTAVLSVVVDINKLKAEEAKVRESEARFRAFANSAPIVLWVLRPDASVEFVNQAGIEQTGLTTEEFADRDWGPLFHPDDRAAVLRAHDEAWANRKPCEFVARIWTPAKEWRWIRAIEHPRYEDEGRFAGYVGASMDVTELREAEMHQRLLVNELNHRVKNTLATVQSIAQQTLRRGMEPQFAREAFVDRLLALSAAHNVLTRERWRSADLREVAATAVRPYGEGDRIRLRGPPARLAPQVAVALSMALHELATNAAKYGALSRPAGRVDVVWRLADDGARFRLRWRERNGPPVVPPTRRGFGMRLLTQGLAAEFGAPAILEYPPGGVVCNISGPTLEPDPRGASSEVI